MSRAVPRSGLVAWAVQWGDRRGWWLWGIYSKRELAWQAMREARQMYPDDSYRVVPYMPEVKE